MQIKDYENKLRIKTKSFFYQFNSNHREVDGSLPMHPDVRLKPLPFFKIHDILLKPTSLQTTSNARLQVNTANLIKLSLN